MNITELKQHIVQNNLQRKILEALGLNNIKEDDNKIQCCNIDGDNPNAILIYKNNEDLMVIDFTRDIKDERNSSDIFSLVEFVKECDFVEAINWVKEVLEIDNTFTQKELTEQDKLNYILNNSGLLLDEQKENELLPELEEEKLQAFLNWNNTVFYDDNISYETQAEFEIGLDVHSHRATIPIRDEFGRLVGVKGRRVWDIVDNIIQNIYTCINVRKVESYMVYIRHFHSSNRKTKSSFVNPKKV